MIDVSLHHAAPKTLFGFWVYIMTDCILFSTLFVVYVVLRNGTWDGPTAHDLFNAPHALAETLVLLTSSFLCGPAALAALKGNKKGTLAWFSLIFLLGATFLFLELTEFIGMVKAGNSWERSGFLSAFFTLVGAHGTHITIGLLWMLVLMGQVAFRGLTVAVLRRLSCLRLFWHFLDVVWIFIFTVVYLMGIES